MTTNQQSTEVREGMIRADKIGINATISQDEGVVAADPKQIQQST